MAAISCSNKWLFLWANAKKQKKCTSYFYLELLNNDIFSSLQSLQSIVSPWKIGYMFRPFVDSRRNRSNGQEKLWIEVMNRSYEQEKSPLQVNQAGEKRTEFGRNVGTLSVQLFGLAIPFICYRFVTLFVHRNLNLFVHDMQLMGDHHNPKSFFLILSYCRLSLVKQFPLKLKYPCYDR